MLAAGDAYVAEIVGLSLRVSGAAVLIGVLLGVPVGVAVGLGRFRGRQLVITLIHTGFALPPVVVGLFVYMLLSRQGPAGALGLLFTPAAMVLAQAVLAAPYVAGITLAAVQAVPPDVRLQARALGASRARALAAHLREARLGIGAAVVAGFGAVISEVGAVMMVGGNIQGETRVITDGDHARGAARQLRRRPGARPHPARARVRGEPAAHASAAGPPAGGLALPRCGAAMGVTRTDPLAPGTRPEGAGGLQGHAAGTGAAPLLRAEGLVRRYGGRTVLSVDAIEVAPGEVLAVLGPNGAGKSTLFRLLLLLERPDAGRVLLDGREVRAGDSAAMRRNGGGVPAALPVLRDGGVQRRVRPPRARRAAEGAGAARRGGPGLARARPLASAPVQALSGGEAQKVALARALASRPDVLLLDEPTANLDVTVRRRFREDLEAVVRSHARAAVLITHDPSDALALADRIAVLEAGRVVQVGTPEELVLEPATPFVAAFTGAELLLDGVVLGRDEDLLVIEVDGGGRLVARAAPGGGALQPGAEVHVAYRPEDVVLAPTDGAAETSARNRFRVVVTGLVPAGGLVRVRLGGPVALAAAITRMSAEALGLAPGREVVAQLKAAALRAFPARGGAGQPEDRGA